MEKKIPRILIAGTHSGCGKTTVTLALLQMLVNKKIKTCAFKCGPDYIDPMFHSRIVGAASSNLDVFLQGEQMVNSLLEKNSRDCQISVIEGVMGFYDGLGIDSVTSSTYEIAKITRTPVILVIDAKGAALSVLAVIEGFLNFYPENHIKGVILNQCSPMTYSVLANAIEEHFHNEVKRLGYLKRMDECQLKSRHLGLVTAAEVDNLKEKMQLLAQNAEKTLDLDGIIALANFAEPLEYSEIKAKKHSEAVRIAVADDEAFCFRYKDNIDILEQMGAKIVYFSPLRDEKLPDDIHGLYLCGGYPELYKEQLSLNKAMAKSIKNALDNHLPCIAECGGFMYLTESIDEFPMVGHLKGHCENTGKLTRFGYVTLTANKDNMLCSKGDSINAHEFHYWDCSDCGEDFLAVKASGKSWTAITAHPYLYAGFPHFHFCGNMSFAKHFYEACEKEARRHD